MATTSYGVNSLEAVKLWSRKLMREALKQTWARKLMGTDSNSVIQILEDTSKGPGDRIRCTLRMLLSGDGILGDGTLEGNEEALTTYTDDLLIDQLRHAVRSGGKMSDQRIPFSVRQEAMQGLTDWWSDRIDQAFFSQVAGKRTYPAGTTRENVDLRYVGHNTTNAPSTTHRIIGGETTESSSLNTAATATALSFKIELLNEAVEKAKTLSPQIRPVRVDGAEKYVCILHPSQVRQLRSPDNQGGTGQWLDIQTAAMKGGSITNNPIYTGAIGEYNGVILHESSRIPIGEDLSGTELSNVRRAVFLGAQAATMAFGRGFGPSRMSWVEELFDYRNQLGVSAGMIWGMKKTRFNTADFATITISTNAYSA